MKTQLPVLVIPAYQPSANLIGLVQELRKMPYQAIVVVNDGSSRNKDNIFDALKLIPGVAVLRHAINLGKGQALKHAFNYVMLNFPLSPGVVTVDADGQHRPRDVLKVALALMDSPKKLILGSREFSEKVPLRSRFGNIVTRNVFAFFIGRKLKDTQTGLRGIPLSYIPQLLRLKSTGYEFELDMLMIAGRGIGLREVLIETVYEPGNPTSHFNPVLDSAKIYFVFLRFGLSSVATAMIDYIVFSISFFASANILMSTILARSMAGPFNFLVGRSWVFHSRGKAARELFLYVSLVLITLALSYVMVDFLTTAGINVFISKLMAEGGLFLASFAIQRTLIFSSRSWSEILDVDHNAESRIESYYKAQDFVLNQKERPSPMRGH